METNINNLKNENEIVIYYQKFVKRTSRYVTVNVYLLKDKNITRIGTFKYDSASFVSDVHEVEKYLKKMGYPSNVIIKELY